MASSCDQSLIEVNFKRARYECLDY